MSASDHANGSRARPTKSSDSYLPAHSKASCDMFLEAEGTRLPVHSQILQVNSTVWNDLISEFKEKESSDPLVVPLQEKVSEIELVLKVLYGLIHKANIVKRRECEIREWSKVRTFQDAEILGKIGDKYDIPLVIKACEDIVCSHVHEMVLGSTTIVGDPFPTSEDSYRDFGKWLAHAERLGMEDLVRECQYWMAEYCFQRFSFDCLMKELKDNNVTSTVTGEVTYALANYFRNSGKRTIDKALFMRYLP